MRDAIFERQNKEDVLELLYAQRILYNQAEVFNGIGWGMTVLLFFLEVGKFFIPFLEHSSYMIGLILALGIFVMDYKTNTLINRGANIKGLIDSILFGFSVHNKENLMEYSIKIKNKRKEDYRIQAAHRGDDSIKGIRDWYTQYDSDNHCKVILNCQKENIWWNKELVNYYKRIIMACISFSFLVGLAVISCLTIKIDYACGLMILGGTILIRSIEQIRVIKEYLKAMEHAQGKVEVIEAQNNNLNLESLQSLQKDIDEIRKSGFLVPGWVHQIYSKQLHKEKKELNEHVAH